MGYMKPNDPWIYNATTNKLIGVKQQDGTESFFYYDSDPLPVAVPFNLLDTTQSTSTTTGSFTTDGGVGIVKNLYVGGTANVVSTSVGVDHLLITTTDAGATVGPDIVLYRNSASPAISDTIGRIAFRGKDSAGNIQSYGSIHGNIASPTSTSESGQIHIQVTVAGATGVERVRITEATSAISNTNASVVITGGLGVSEDSYINGVLVGVSGTGTGLSATNTAVGLQALEDNTGTNVSGFGNLSAYNNTGTNVTAFGYAAAYQNTGSTITALGSQSGYGNTGDSVTAIGVASLRGNTGNGNTAIGYSAMYPAVCTGINNTAGGVSSLDANTSGTLNSAWGANSLGSVTTGASNVGIGSTAGSSLTTGSDCTIIGAAANVSSNSDSNAIVIGKSAVGLGSNTTAIGVSTTTLAKMVGTTTSVFSISGDTVRVETQRTPASAIAAGTKGDICHDTLYIYVCTANNTWKRVAISTW